MHWFEVDRKGLAKILERRGVGWILYELIQNAIDEEGVTEVRVSLGAGPKRGTSALTVTDDSPEGFRRLSDAWTLFATSYKAGNPNQRGRFNSGEKHVLALCESAIIRTTKGTVIFDQEGRHESRKGRERGTEFTAVIRMTQEQRAEAIAAVRRMIPPETVRIYIGDGFEFEPTPLPRPEAVAAFRATLQTEFADEEGILRRTKRQTTVDVYEAKDGIGWVYEMGVPIVETGDRWNYDVHQKVPQSMERDNVPPAFLQTLRTEALNHLHSRVTTQDANETWVRDALSSPDCSPDAFRSVLDRRFGENRVMADPTDTEATKRAMAAGQTIVYGNQLTKGERDNIRTFRQQGWDPVVPAGQSDFATEKPFAKDGKPPKIIPQSEYTDDQKRVSDYTKAVAKATIDQNIGVVIMNEPGWGVLAAYSKAAQVAEGSFAEIFAILNREDRPTLILNLGDLGEAWFKDTSPAGLEEVHALLIHEFGHETEADHLSKKFNDALCLVGARLARKVFTGALNPRDFGFE